MLSKLFNSKQKEKENIFPLTIKYTGEEIKIDNKNQFLEFIEHCNAKGYQNIESIKTEE